MADCTIELLNDSAEDANELRLLVSPIIGLNDVLWTCGAPCAPPNGSEGIDLMTNLPAGCVLLIGLTGALDSSVPFVEIIAQISLPEGTAVFLPDDDRRVFIEPASAEAVHKSGFE